jgi:hypothetical protein
MRSWSIAAATTIYLAAMFIAEPLEAAHNSISSPTRSAKNVPASSARRARRPANVPSCTGSGSNSFVGVTGGNNVAGEVDSAVLGGTSNDACSSNSVIAGGLQNGVDANRAFIGGGLANGNIGNDAFIGAGLANATSANGAFVGAGGQIYYIAQQSNPADPGNIASGSDSFVGAGDLNQVSGQGSFIGAGGSSYAQTGVGAAANSVSGVDSFIGAGDQNTVNNSFSFVGGGELNSVSGLGSFVGAGGYLNTSGLGNSVTGNDSFIGAGDSNTVVPDEAFIGGGASNQITNGKSGAGSRYAAIGGGLGNSISPAVANGAEYGAIAGGIHNSLSGIAGAIGGGYANVARGTYATVPGGERDLAAGSGSFAAGINAQAIQDGTFAWSDGDGSLALKTTKPYQFVTRASGGYVLYSNAGETVGVQLTPGSGAWASLSDRAAKSGVTPIDDDAVLAKVAALPVSEWSYTSERGVRHVGPMAQDFYAAFRIGADDRHITSIDEDGVALAGIKALAAQNHGLHVENRYLRERLAQAAARLTRDEAQRNQDHARFLALERKVEAMSAR